MIHPKRIQRRRSPGWTLASATSNPNGAVYVGRPTRLGNPFTTDMYVKAGRVGYRDVAEGRRLAAEDFERWLVGGEDGLWCGPVDESVDARRFLLRALPTLAGRDLLCWCPLPEPGQPDHCHGAVLLRLAAGEEI